MAASMVGGYYQGLHSNDALDFLREYYPFLALIDRAPDFAIFLFILFNNAFKVLVAMFAGIFFGIAPLYFIYSNGFLLGMVTPLIVKNGSWQLLAAGILPHGIIELSAVLIGATYGLWLGVKMFRLIFFKEPIDDVFKIALLKYVRVIVPMLLLAAIIEAYVTPIVMGIISG